MQRLSGVDICVNGSMTVIRLEFDPRCTAWEGIKEHAREALLLTDLKFKKMVTMLGHVSE